MSFIDDIVNAGRAVYDWATGDSLGAKVARTAVTGYALRKLNESINKENETSENKKVDQGVREQVDPNTEYSIPVVYGQATLGGVVTDAVLTDSNQVMWYCLVLCEQTGDLLSTAQPSAITFNTVYWNQNRMNFAADGFTVASFEDEDGVIDTSPAGLIRVYAFSGNSQTPAAIQGYANHNQAAYDIFPNWTSEHQMNSLIFALVRVQYDSVNRITGLGRMEFTLTNSMTLPGDCLYDMMTNTRYGAGISPQEIAI